MAKTFGMQGTTDEQLCKYAQNCCKKINDALLRLNHSYENFLNDTVFQDAIAKNLADLGELFNSFSEDVKIHFDIAKSHRYIKAMRNALDHEYPIISPIDIWDDANEVLPHIQELLDAIEIYVSK